MNPPTATRRTELALVLASLILTGLPSMAPCEEDKVAVTLLARDAEDWFVPEGGSVVCIRDDGGLAIYRPGDSKLQPVTDADTPVRSVRQISPRTIACLLGKPIRGYGMSSRTAAEGVLLYDVPTGRKTAIADANGLYVLIPAPDANAPALMLTARNGDAYSVSVMKIDPKTHKTRSADLVKGQYFDAWKLSEDGKTLDVWTKSTPAEEESDSTQAPTACTQWTVNVASLKTAGKEVPESEVPNTWTSPRRPNRARQRNEFDLIGRMGKITRTNQGRLILTRDRQFWDLFGKGEYSARVYPDRAENPRRLAVMREYKSGSDTRHEIVLVDLADKASLSRFGDASDMDIIRGWSPKGKRLVIERFSRDKKDPAYHGLLTIYEPDSRKRMTLLPPKGRRYVNYLGFLREGWMVTGMDRYHDEAIRSTLLMLVDVRGKQPAFAPLCEGKLFKWARLGDRMVFSDFDGEEQSYKVMVATLPDSADDNKEE